MHPVHPVHRVPADAARPLVVGAQGAELLGVVVLAVARVGRLRAGVVAEAAVVAPRVRSVEPAARPAVAVSRRSSAVKSLTRWKRHRLVASASSKATARRSGSPEAHR